MAETRENPANQTLLLAMVGKPFYQQDFEKLWYARDMPSRHPRFHQKVKTTDRKQNSNDKGGDAAATETSAIAGKKSAGVFVPTQLPLQSHVKETEFPQIYNLDLQRKLQSFLQVPLQVQNLLWQVELSPGGSLGQSGAIPKERAAELLMNANTNDRNGTQPQESLLIFRGHEALGDGISLVAALTDLCDEAEELKKELAQEMDRNKRNRRKLSWWQRFFKFVQSLYNYSIGSLHAFWHFWILSLKSSRNSFQQLEALLTAEDTTTRGEKLISWIPVASLEEIEHVAKSMSKSTNQPVTVQDVILSCVAAAVARQLQNHQMENERDQTSKRNIKVPDRINVRIHDTYNDDAVLARGETVSHAMGTMYAAIPCDVTSLASQRLAKVHASLREVPKGPALFWSRKSAQIVSAILPAAWANRIFQKVQPNAAISMTTMTNGPAGGRRKLHMGGREVEVFQCFLPLPAGVPIGLCATTYGGEVSLSITAEPWAVPNADTFLSWVLDEYKFLYTESPVVLEGS